jgi:hypothetical protein
MRIRARYIIIITYLLINLIGYMILRLEVPGYPVSLGEAIGKAIWLYCQAVVFIVALTAISIICLIIGFILKKKELKIGFFATTAISMVLDIMVICFN